MFCLSQLSSLLHLETSKFIFSVCAVHLVAKIVSQTCGSSFIEFSDLLTYCNTLKGSYLIDGNLNVHYDHPPIHYTAKLIYLIESFGLVRSTSVPTHKRVHTLDLIS